MGYVQDTCKKLPYQRVYPNKGTKATTGLCRISDAHDTLSGSVFAWVHATTEDLPLPDPYPIGRQTAEVQAVAQRRMHWRYLQPVCVTSRECAHV